jgi:hypothetical protein
VRIRDGEVADDRVLAAAVVPPIAETEPVDPPVEPAAEAPAVIARQEAAR